MRVLLTTPAGLGHLHPTVPLARAMVARGHEVVWAAPPDGVDHIRRAGIRALPIGTAGLTRPADARRRFPELDALPAAEMPDVLFGKMFGAMATPVLLADLSPFARQWRPDLVVADAAEFAGHIVAAELGVPSVTKGFGPLLPERRVALAGDEVAGLWRDRGLDPRPYGGTYDHLYLDIYPPGLDVAEAPHVPRRQRLRPVPYDGVLEGGHPLPLPDSPSGWPLVYVTMGTVFNDLEPLRLAVEGLAALAVRVLVTVGPRADPAALGASGSHVRVERYVPQTLVLPSCDVVVSHGGSGTVMAALGHGLPQLCLPQGADQFLNATAVAAAGAGLALVPGEATAEGVAEAVTRLLGDDAFGSAARGIAASMAAMPSPDEVGAVLEAHVAAGR